MQGRRHFLSALACSLASWRMPSCQSLSSSVPPACWLEVAAPLVLDNSAHGWQSELVLTSDTFVGARGYEDGADATEYEICLYDVSGKPLGAEGITKRLMVPAMRATTLAVRELLPKNQPFAGGLKIRLRPRARETMPASDLFSSAFIRWQTFTSFDNVHANPDPRQWQNTDSFFYSMPFPSLSEYESVLSLFNPNARLSAGELVMYDPKARRMHTQGYELTPRASLFFDLNARRLTTEPWQESKFNFPGTHGLIAVTNKVGTAKSFGYLLINQRTRQRFSIEHPIHQGIPPTQQTRPAPFDERQQFKARNILYSPLLFKGKRFGGVKGGLTFDSRVYLGAGLPAESHQWLYPFAVDAAGKIAWSSQACPQFAQAAPGQIERGLFKLDARQSAMLDFQELSLPNDFAGGLGIAVAPDLSHTLLKVEVRVREWGAFAFTHFRPGLRSARLYQQNRQRGGLVTDYIVSGARLSKPAADLLHDELLGIINIDDQEIAARPMLELFNTAGLIKRVSLGVIPPLACRHFLLSELIAENLGSTTMTFRLVDERAALLMSVAHLDYQRRDLALDHGSDRFSTLLDYGCA